MSNAADLDSALKLNGKRLSGSFITVEKARQKGAPKETKAKKFPSTKERIKAREAYKALIGKFGVVMYVCGIVGWHLWTCRRLMTSARPWPSTEPNSRAVHYASRSPPPRQPRASKKEKVRHTLGQDWRYRALLRKPGWPEVGDALSNFTSHILTLVAVRQLQIMMMHIPAIQLQNDVLCLVIQWNFQVGVVYKSQNFLIEHLWFSFILT